MVIPTSPLSLGISFVPGQAPMQTPFALVLGCSDARAPIEIIFDRSSNELFIVRVAGNVLGTECLGSLEYAARHLSSDLRLVVVLGHSGCGAVGAAVDLYLAPGGYIAIAATHSLRTILDRILFVVRIADKALERRCGPSASTEPGYRAALWEMAVYLNAALTAHDLSRELGLTGGDGAIRVVYSVYDIAGHRVSTTPNGDPSFAPAPRTADEFGIPGRPAWPRCGLDLRHPPAGRPVAQFPDVEGSPPIGARPSGRVQVSKSRFRSSSGSP